MLTYGFVHLLLEILNVKTALIVSSPLSRHGTSRAPGIDILLSTSPLYAVHLQEQVCRHDPCNLNLVGLRNASRTKRDKPCGKKTNKTLAKKTMGQKR